MDAKVMLRALVSLLLISLLMNVSLSLFFDISLTGITTNVVSDIYEYANPQAQEVLHTQLDAICNRQEEVVEVNITEQCQQEQIAAIKEQCSTYIALPEELKQEDAVQSCQQVLDGRFERSCKLYLEEDTKAIVLSQQEYTEDHCKDLTSGSLSYQEFFVSMTKSSMPDTDNIDVLLEKSDSPFAKSIANKMSTVQMLILNPTTVVLIGYIILFAVFVALLYVLRESTAEFFTHLGSSFIGVGVLVFFSYIVIWSILSFAPPDTSALLTGSLSGEAQVQSVNVLVPLVLSHIYTADSLIFAGIILFLGILLKVYGHMEQKNE